MFQENMKKIRDKFINNREWRESLMNVKEISFDNFGRRRLDITKYVNENICWGQIIRLVNESLLLRELFSCNEMLRELNFS